jgi:helix-turn-helix protein
MAGDVLAQFRGNVDAERADWRGPRDAKVALTRDRLALHDGEESVTIPLQSVFDVNPGSRPQVFDPLGGVPITIAYELDGERTAAAVAGKEETIRKFTTALFKTMLDDTLVRLNHPARRGGRVTGQSFEPGILSLASQGVTVDADGRTVPVETAAVVDFSRQSQDVDGTEMPTLVVRHMVDGAAVTTCAATGTGRELSLLGRYLRREYDGLVSSVQSLSLSRVEIRALVTLYTTGGRVAIEDVLGLLDEQKRQLYEALSEKALIQSGKEGPELTTRGQVVVNHYIDEVNT